MGEALPRIEEDLFLQRRCAAVFWLFICRVVFLVTGETSPCPWLGGESLVELQPREGGVASRGERDVEGTNSEVHSVRSN